MQTPTVSKKFRSRFLKILKILLIVFVLLYGGAYLYVSANKDKIILQLTEQVSRKLNGKLVIGDADISLFSTFPKISVKIKDILLTDTMYQQHRHPFFSAKAVYANLSIMKLIKKQSALTGIRIDDGSIYLFTDTSGYTNTYLLKSKKDPEGGPKKTSEDIIIKTVKLKNLHIVLDDRKKEKLHDFQVSNLSIKLDDGDDNLVMHNEADILVKSLAFNLPKGTFLKEATFRGDFDMKYGKASQLLSFDSINIKIASVPFNLSGSFDLGDKNPGFSLRVHARKVLYEDIKKLLPKRISNSLSIVTLDKRLDADALLTGPLQGGEPYIMATWKVNDTRLTSPFADFDKASFTGLFTNEVTPGLPRNDPNSVIIVNNFKAEWRSLPVVSNKIQILDLSVPELSCDMHSSFPLTTLNEVIENNSLQLSSGTGDVLLTYKGPIQKNDNTNSFLNGNISFKNGTMMFVPRNIELKSVNGLINFQNSDVFIQNLQCVVLNNKIVMNGVAKNLLTLINTDPNRVRIDYNIYSPSLNLGSFTYLLKKNQRAPVVAKKKSPKSLGSMAGKIDNILQQSSIQVSLKADQLIYKNFRAANASADISLLRDRYVISNAGMSVAGGSMGLSAQLVNAGANFHTATVNAALNNVDVKKIFTAFDNFGQDAISGKNLEGNLTSKVLATMNITDAGAVVPSSVNGTVDFSLKNGALNDFEPIKKMQRFIFKKRDFGNIRFAELKDRLEINKSEIKINRMEIQSSVMTLFVEGIYSTKGKTDLSIQVPLNNIVKKADEFNLINLGTDKKGGRSIFLRGRPGSDGNVDFKLDLFKKFQKDQKKNEEAKKT